MLYKILKCAIPVLVLAVFSTGQLINFFPGFRNIANELTNIRAVEDIFQTSGDFVADSLNFVSDPAISIARALGVGHEIPHLLNGVNTVGLTDDFQAKFAVGSRNEDTKLAIDELIIKYGYPLQKHQTVTQDKYVLSMYRIPGKGPPVFLMHGLLGSADDFVVNGPDRALAFLLANDGFDVWLGNARGNKHSRQHLTLRPSEAQFWDFSWHEIGLYDLPAMIDYVLNNTGQEKLRYIGHSQGTTTFFVMASERAEYNKKIEVMVALSGVAFMEHAKSPLIGLMAPGTDIILAATRSIGIYEFLPDNIVMRTLKFTMCGHGPLAELVCGNAVFLIAGFSFGQMNATALPVILSHLPSGASSRQFAHYGQGVVTGEFRRFDFGRAENLRRYGTETPARYPLERVDAPVHIFFSQDDWLADPLDVSKLSQGLGNVAGMYRVPYAPFNHLDFVFGKDFKSLIYSRIRDIL